MKHLAMLAVVYSASISSAQASEGTFLAALSSCHAHEANAVVVNTCVKSHPEMAAELTAALEAWKLRYGEKAAAVAKRCESELKSHVASEELDPSKLSEVKETLLGKYREAASSADPKFCRTVASHMGRPSRHEDQMWSEK
jgi:hypothetical protein